MERNTYIISGAKLAAIEALQAWSRLHQTPDFATQNEACREPVTIGSLPTYWSRGLSGTLPPFVQTSVGNVRFLLVYIANVPGIAIYEKVGREWERSTFVRGEAAVLAALPKRAIQAEMPVQPASEKQLSALRKFLGLDAAVAMPAISSAMCSRLIDHMTVERAFEKIRPDLDEWAKESAYEPSLTP